MSLIHTQTKGFQLSTSKSKGKDVYWVHYSRDGMGRDDYIALNNGGLNPVYHAASKQINNGSQFYVGNDQGGPRGNVHPTIQAKTINYARNGTGRDTYIAYGNGGFFPPGQTDTIAAFTQNFQDQLRVSHFRNVEPTIDY